MSAFLVSHNHIRFLVHAAQKAQVNELRTNNDGEGILGLEMNLRREQTNRLAGSHDGNRDCQDREDQLDQAPHLRSQS